MRGWPCATSRIPSLSRRDHAAFPLHPPTRRVVAAAKRIFCSGILIVARTPHIVYFCDYVITYALRGPVMVMLNSKLRPGWVDWDLYQRVQVQLEPIERVAKEMWLTPEKVLHWVEQIMAYVLVVTTQEVADDAAAGRPTEPAEGGWQRSWLRRGSVT